MFETSTLLSNVDNSTFSLIGAEKNHMASRTPCTTPGSTRPATCNKKKAQNLGKHFGLRKEECGSVQREMQIVINIGSRLPYTNAKLLRRP